MWDNTNTGALDSFHPPHRPISQWLNEPEGLSLGHAPHPIPILNTPFPPRRLAGLDRRKAILCQILINFTNNPTYFINTMTRPDVWLPPDSRPSNQYHIVVVVVDHPTCIRLPNPCSPLAVVCGREKNGGNDDDGKDNEKPRHPARQRRLGIAMATHRMEAAWLFHSMPGRGIRSTTH